MVHLVPRERSGMRKPTSRRKRRSRSRKSQNKYEFFFCPAGNYEDFASGRVIYGAKGIPNFPVRLIAEIFGRALKASGKKDRLYVYDPCCRGACHIEPAIKRYGLDELTAWVDMPLPETVECIDLDERRVVADETVREMLLRKCGARTIPEFRLHTKDRQKDIVRDVMRELGAGPRQMVRISGMTYAVVYKIWKDL